MDPSCIISMAGREVPQTVIPSPDQSASPPGRKL